MGHAVFILFLEKLLIRINVSVIFTQQQCHANTDNNTTYNSLNSRMSHQVDRIGKQLYDRLVSEWGLLRELRLLRNAFLMGAPVLHGFAHELFTRLTRVGACKACKLF